MRAGNAVVVGGHVKGAGSTTDSPGVIVTIGEAMVEFAEQPGGHFISSPGGDASNVAIAAPRQSVRSRFLSCLGADAFGEQWRAVWAAEGVDARWVDTLSDAPTGIYFSFAADANGTRRYEYRRTGSAASRIGPDVLQDGMFDRAAWLHSSSISQCISDTAAATVLAAARRARATGVKISYDTNYRPRLSSPANALKYVQAMLEMTDLFLPSREDLALLTGIADVPGQLTWCARQGVRQVVLKDGANGAWCVDGTQASQRDRLPLHLPAPQVQATDTSGAGDCFVGTLLAQFTRGLPLAEAVKHANVAAALSVTRPGAVASYPTRAETDEAVLRGIRL